MKNITLLMALVASTFFYSTCSNELDLTADWKDIPIVYGLVSTVDSVSYIRVEKAFLDNSISALDIAQNPDSLYYDDVSVKLVSLDPNNPGSYDLTRIDGNLEGLQRETGIFASAPNYLYKLEFFNGERLNGGSEYELQINRGDNLPLVTAREIALRDIKIQSPDNDPSTANPINWVRSGLRVEWETEPEASLFDVTVSFVIVENDVANPANNQTITLDWKIGENLDAEIDNSGEVDMDIRLNKLDLFTFLTNRLEVKPNISRKVVSINILVKGAGLQLSEYISAGNANTGITSTQVIPTYTNLSEGYGIFSTTTSTYQEGYILHNETIDSLRNNNLTKDLNFQF